MCLHRTLILALWLMLCAVAVSAQQGPRIPPCEGCPISPTERPYPRAGMWWDPARSGTGMNLEAQNGIVVGTWHGFDEEGDPIWYQFSGELEPVTDGNAGDGYWTVDAPLAEFVGGSCLDCPFRPAEVAGVRGTISLTVVQRNLISYRIDDGEEYRMQPLVWGTPMPQIFPEVADHGQPMYPDDERVSEWAPGVGQVPWVLITRTPDPPDRMYLNSTSIFWVKSGSSQVSAPYSMAFFQRFPNSPELYVPINMHCGSVGNDTLGTLPDSLLERLGPEPVCILRRVIGTAMFKFYVAPLGDIGDDYFFMTAEDGSVIEGHRLLYR